MKKNNTRKYAKGAKCSQCADLGKKKGSTKNKKWCKDHEKQCDHHTNLCHPANELCSACISEGRINDD